MISTAAFADTLPAQWPALQAQHAPGVGFVDGLSQAFSRWLDASRSRRTLDELDDHLLRDIGLTRSEALRESSKFFWQV